ncbi:hypothetical protein OKW42_004700 [Paraburkholderia sp. WC7.3d]
MVSSERSLRLMVEKWLTPNSAMLVRVTKIRRSRSDHGRTVRIEASRAAGPIELFFFRHSDGTWCVFPPENERPSMSASWRAA